MYFKSLIVLRVIKELFIKVFPKFFRYVTVVPKLPFKSTPHLYTIHNNYPIVMKLCQNKSLMRRYVMRHKYELDLMKIKDFLLVAYF